MHRICDNNGLLGCHAAAEVYYGAVKHGGHKAFRNARRKAKAEYEKACACNCPTSRCIPSCRITQRAARGKVEGDSYFRYQQSVATIMRLRLLAGVLGAATIVGTSASVEDASAVFLVVLGIYMLSPWAFLALGANFFTDRARGIAVMFAALMAVAAYLSFTSDESSTGALVFIFLPIYQWAAIGVIALLPQARRRRITEGEDMSHGET